MNVTYAGQTYKVLSTDGDTMTVTPVSTAKEIVAGSRVRYANRTGTVRNTWFGYCPTHDSHECTCYPGATIDWDDSAKRASSIRFSNLALI